MLKTLRFQVRVAWVYRKTQWVALVATDVNQSPRKPERNFLVSTVIGLMA